MSDRFYNYQKKHLKNYKPKHPYAAIEHRVIDSEAFAKATPTAIKLLNILTRQLNGSNNGHLQATFSYCRPRGIKSQTTLSNAIATLISLGLIYRTKSSGPRRQWAKYAVTWFPITDAKGLYLKGFVKDAFLNVP